MKSHFNETVKQDVVTELAGFKLLYLDLQDLLMKSKSVSLLQSMTDRQAGVGLPP